MTRAQRQIKANKTQHQQSIEHLETFDDSLLPDAGEIQKLAAIDPDILNWLKARAEQEQQFRHTITANHQNNGKSQNRREHNTARYAIFIYFVLVAGCMACCYLLVDHGKNVQGSIFGGVGCILALAVLISRSAKKEGKPQK
jgi:uncharacterized membrane protein